MLVELVFDNIWVDWLGFPSSPTAELLASRRATERPWGWWGWGWWWCAWVMNGNRVKTSLGPREPSELNYEGLGWRIMDRLLKFLFLRNEPRTLLTPSLLIPFSSSQWETLPQVLRKNEAYYMNLPVDTGDTRHTNTETAFLLVGPPAIRSSVLIIIVCPAAARDMFTGAHGKTVEWQDLKLRNFEDAWCWYPWKLICASIISGHFWFLRQWDRMRWRHIHDIAWVKQIRARIEWSRADGVSKPLLRRPDLNSAPDSREREAMYAVGKGSMMIKGYIARELYDTSLVALFTGHLLWTLVPSEDELDRKDATRNAKSSLKPKTYLIRLDPVTLHSTKWSGRSVHLQTPFPILGWKQQIFDANLRESQLAQDQLFRNQEACSIFLEPGRMVARGKTKDEAHYPQDLCFGWSSDAFGRI